MPGAWLQENYLLICYAYAPSFNLPSLKNDGGVNAPVSLSLCQNAIPSNI